MFLPYDSYPPDAGKDTFLRNVSSSVLTRAARRNIPEDGILDIHRRENLKPYVIPHGFIGMDS
jgi:hypothetical protein